MKESPLLTLIMSNEKKLQQKRFHSVSTENTAEQNAEKESNVDWITFWQEKENCKKISKKRNNI